MTIADDLMNEGITFREADQILICPDYAFRKNSGKRSKTKAAKLLDQLESGAAASQLEFDGSMLELCGDLESAEECIDRIAKKISAGRFGVGINVGRLNATLIQCSLWRD
jgi:hypothetical protein